MSRNVCLLCNQITAKSPHHIKTRGAGGKDVFWNLVHLCMGHHTEIHKIGIITFTKKYPLFKRFLKMNSWTITETKIFHSED